MIRNICQQNCKMHQYLSFGSRIPIAEYICPSKIGPVFFQKIQPEVSGKMIARNTGMRSWSYVHGLHTTESFPRIYQGHVVGPKGRGTTNPAALHNQ